LVTTLGVLEFDGTTNRMHLSTYYENVSVEEIARNTGFKLDVTRAKQEPSPTPEEVDVLRTDVDRCPKLIQSWTSISLTDVRFLIH